MNPKLISTALALSGFSLTPLPQPKTPKVELYTPPPVTPDDPPLMRKPSIECYSDSTDRYKTIMTAPAFRYARPSNTPRPLKERQARRLARRNRKR